MRAAVPLTLSLCAIACSAAGSRSVVDSGGAEASAPATADTSVAPRSVAQPAPAPRATDRLARGLASIEEPEGRALLREELASGGPDAAAAALALVDWFTARDALADALAVVTAIRATPADDRTFALIESRLLYDSARFDDAARVLEPLVASAPEEPRARWELAEVERCRGRCAEALAQLDALESAPAAAEFVAARRAELKTLRAELANEAAGGGHRATPRELLALVRGADDPVVRHGALRALVAVDATRARATAVALQQDDATLRTAAVRAVRGNDPDAEAVLLAALDDADERVRGAAYGRSVQLLGAAAIPLVLERLDAEESGYAFRCAHTALRARLGPRVDLAPGAELAPGARARTVADWRMVWDR